MSALPDITLQAHSQVYSAKDWAQTTFIQLVNDEKLRLLRVDAWESDATPEYGDCLYHMKTGSTQEYVMRLGDTVTMLYCNSDGTFSAYVAAMTEEAISQTLNTLREQLPVREPVEGTVSVRFWSLTSNGPSSTSRRIVAPSFDEIRGNYTNTVRNTIDHMLSEDFQPGHGGQLLLWYGTPGTGKTWALRSLARAWQSWCKIEYVTDPEAFFGKAAYLMNVLVGQESTDKWRLLIFEDTGELMASDARSRTGQGLSRLLNSVDGFIGQGLKTLIMMTSNEDINQLNEAISRPGRCAVRQGFGPLTAAEAATWWKETTGQTRALSQGSASLAQLYAEHEGYRVQQEIKTVGFRGAA